MNVSNEATVGSGENTPLIGSSPVVGTTSQSFPSLVKSKIQRLLFTDAERGKNGCYPRAGSFA